MGAKILAFAGSSRKESFNRRLLNAAVDLATAQGATVTTVDLGEFGLPIFNEDDEAALGLHPGARRLKDQFLANDGLLIACPEYNGSITPLLKNAIDWVSRPVPGEAPLNCFKGKVCALLATSAGALGGLRGLVHVRAILSGIGVIVLPDQFALSKGHEAFDAAGKFKDEKQRATVDGIVGALVRTTTRLKG